MDKKVTKQELEQVINSLIDAFNSESKEEHYEMCLKYLNKYGTELLDPEHYNLFVSFELENFHTLLISNLLSRENKSFNNYTRDQKESLIFLYENYQFADSHIDKIIEKKEGLACSADKARYLLKSYKNYVVSGKLPDFGSRDDYWIPDYGSAQNWMLFINSLKYLYYGHADKYVELRQNLLTEIESEHNVKKEEQKQLFLNHPKFSHSLQMEKNDGTIYCFVCNEENVLLNVHIFENRTNGYILEINHNRVKSGDYKPKWVEDLLNVL